MKDTKFDDIDCAACPVVRTAEDQSSGSEDEEEEFDIKKEAWFLGISVLLAAGAFAAKRWMPDAPQWSALLFIASYLVSGWNVLAGAAKNVLHGRVFDELFLMSVATIGAIVIGQYAEAVGVMVFFKLGEMLEDAAAEKSRKSVRGLLDLRPDMVRVKKDDGWDMARAESTAVGTEYLVLAGERVPLDGCVIKGEAFVDTQALTGEPVPRRAGLGAEVLAGYLVSDGSLTLKSERPAGESSAARIAELVENASKAKAKSEKFITRFAKVYTPIVVGLALAVAFLPPLLAAQPLKDWVYRALVMLVISCPCALVISVPLGYFGGIGGLAKRGVLVKGGAVLDKLAAARTVVFDKTGTLTKGSFKVIGIKPESGFDEREVLEAAAAAEARSTHPIAASIRQAAKERGWKDGSDAKIESASESAGFGIIAEVDGHRILAGNDRLLHRENIAHSHCNVEGTTVKVAVDGAYAGDIRIGDEPKTDAAQAVSALRSLGVSRTVMLTGDDELAARPVAEALGLSEYHAGLLPDGKLKEIETIMSDGGGTVFVGDGINDAPVLARADVGIAMGAGAQVAVECADVVLMNDEPSRVAEAISRSRRTKRIVMENIIFALGVKIVFLILGALGMAVMWEAVIADVGVSLLATLNATRALGRGIERRA